MPSTTRGSDRPPKPGRLRAALWILLGLVVGGGIAWIALALAFPPQRVRVLVQRQLGSMLAREVRFSDARLGLWPLVRLTVQNPALADSGGFSTGTAIQARSLHLDLDLFALLGRRYVIRRLTLVEPSAHVVLHRDGSTNLSRMGAPPQPRRPASPMDFEITRLKVERGRVLLDDLATGRRTAFALDTDMGFKLAGRGMLVTAHGNSKLSEIAIGPLRATRVAELNRSLAGLEWKIDHDATLDLARKRLAIERFAVGLGRTEIALAGTAEISSGSPELNLRARGTQVDLGQVLDYLARAEGRALNGIDGGGRLDFELGIQGRLGAARRPMLTGSVAIRDGSFRYPGAPAAIEKANFDVKLETEVITIPELRAEVAGQPVKGRLTLTRLDDPLVTLGLAGDLDLATIARLVAPKDAVLSGRVALDLRGHGRMKDPGSIALEGWMRAANVALQAPALPKKLENVRGELRFSAARVLVNGLSVQAGKSSFVFDGSMSRPLALMAKRAPGGGYTVAPAGVQFTLRSPYLDLAELMPLTPGGPMLSNARGTGRVSIGRFRNQRVDLQRVNAELALRPDVVDVTRFALTAYGGSVSGRARFDSTDPVLPALTLDAKLDSCLLDGALGAWVEAGKFLHGRVSSGLELSLRGTTPRDMQRSLTAQGEALLRNGKLGPMPVLEEIARVTRTSAFREITFRDGKVPFRVQNGQVATGPVKLVGSLGEWNLGGMTGFDGSLDHVVSITLPPDVTARLGQIGAIAAGALGDEEGRVLIDLRVGGTAKDPKVRLDERAMRDRFFGKFVKGVPLKDLPLKMPKFLPMPGDTSFAAESLRAVERAYRRAIEDSLKKRARDVLKDFFGSKKDTTRK